MRGAVVAVLVVAVVVAGCGGQESPGQQPGNPAVYQRIEQETDCVTLQGEFDQAEQTSQRPGGPEGATWSEIGIAYMQAAEARMREVGCH